MRTGIAVCDKDEVLASPVCVIKEYNMQVLVKKIGDIAKERRCELIVVGLPRNMDGSEGESAQNAMKLADMLRVESGIGVTLYDERCTTVTAHNYLNDTNTRGKKRKDIVDSVAAVVILQDYINYRKNKAYKGL